VTDAAQLHRPSDRATLRAAAAELRQRGLRPRDVGQALGISEDAVRELLQLPPDLPVEVSR
jgi:hypothetical protein